MIIEIPGVQTYEGIVQPLDNSGFLEYALGGPKHVHHVTHTTVSRPVKKENDRMAQLEVYLPASKFYMAAHDAFDKHVSLSLSPELFWYAIMHELAILVKSEPAKYGHYFSKTPDKKIELLVRADNFVYGEQNDWTKIISEFGQEMRKHVPSEMLTICLPQFSTLTPVSETALLISFMDMTSDYYSMKLLTACGIPRIKLEGTADDWKLLLTSAMGLMSLFPELYIYFKDLCPVLEKIYLTAAGLETDIDFWSSLYKVKHESGGPYITGWLTALSAYVMNWEGNYELKNQFDWAQLHRSRGGFTTREFPNHVSQVSFTWDYFGQDISMQLVGGVFGVDYLNDFLTPQLGFGVFEKNA